MGCDSAARLRSPAGRRSCMLDRLEQRVLLALHTPMTAAQFTTALNSAQLGDTIVLQAGTTYTGSFTLANKTSGSGWITIQSSNLSALPPEGVRVSPADAVNMPRIVSPGLNQAAIKTVEYAHHYKFVGVEIVGPADNSTLVTLVRLGDTSSAQDTLAEVPHHIVIDRSYLHPNVRSAQIRRAIALNSAHTDITNSYIEEIHEAGSDSQAIGGWNGPGPFNIINNHLEAASENIMFGGSTAFIPDMVPSDIVVRGNYLYKPPDWRYGTNGYNQWAVKNLFEIKAARRVTIDGNIFENSWVSGQSGVGILLKANLDAAWSASEDITFTNNIVRHVGRGVSLQGYDYAQDGGYLRNITIRNNLFEDVHSSYGGSGWFLYTSHGTQNITVDHNTVFHDGTVVYADVIEKPTYNFTYTNNIHAHNAYGVMGGGAGGIGNNTLNKYFPGATFTKNILIGGNSSLYSQYPGNYFPTSWDAVGMVDRADGDYRLAPSSPYRNAGTDGKDLGADMDAIAHATAGAINGIWFAYKIRSTMYVKFEDPAMPIVLSSDGENLTASKGVTTLPLAGVMEISVSGSAADDRLHVHGPLALPMTFADSGGDDLLEVLSGTVTLPTDIGTPSQNLGVHVAGGATAIFDARQRLRSLDIDGAATLSPGGSKVLRVTDLIIAGKLDLADNDLIVDYSGVDTPLGSWNGSSYSDITGYIQSGRNNGAWHGNGIITSQSDAQNGTTTLAVDEASRVLGIENGETAEWAGEIIDDTAILVKYTWGGDADLNGTLDGDDYFIIDSHVAQSGVVFGYHVGDFNFGGEIDGDDYFIIDGNIAYAQANGWL